MNKKYFLFTILIIALTRGYSQTSTFSPYSIFGLGDINWNGAGKTRSLAGTGIAFKSDNYLNQVNPASYSALDSNQFIFEIGLQTSIVDYKSFDLNQRSTTTNFNYLAMGFRITNWWKNSIGIRPYSHIGYNINVERYIEGTTNTYYTIFKGSGDITQFYWGHAFTFFKNLTIGANVSYIFGPINQEEHVIIPITESEDVITRDKHVSNVYFDLGLQYTLPLEKWDYTFGLTYGSKQVLKTKYSLSYFNSYDTLRTVDNIKGSDYSIPGKFGAGLAVANKEGTFKAGFDYQFEKWEDVVYEYVNVDLHNSDRFSFALELQPDVTDRISYLKRVKYMVGAYHLKSNLSYNDERLKESGITLGFGFPVREKAFIYLGAEAGRRGNLKNGSIMEDFLKFNVSISLKDKWFAKIKYR